MLMIHLSWIPGVDLAGLRALLLQGETPTGTWGLIAHTVHVADEPAGAPDRLAGVAADQASPALAAGLLLWASIVAENAGDVDAARRHAEAALQHDGAPPYLLASLHAELSQLAMAVGDHHRAAHHARISWPLLLQVHSVTDAYSLQMSTALAPLLDGDVDGAEALLEQFGPPEGEGAHMGARMVWQTAQAEVARARGDHPEALRRYDALVGMVIEGEPGAELTPWLVIAASASLVARARHGTEVPDARAEELRDLVLGSGESIPDGSLWFTDLPLNGVLLVALAAWSLRFGPADQHQDAARLLAISHRWAYNRSIPVLAWEPLVALADARLPGLVDRLVVELADRPGPDLLPDAAEVVARLRRAWLTSS